MTVIREFKDIWNKVREGKRLDREDGYRLIRSTNLVELGFMANAVKERLWGNRVHFTHSININPTNICVLTCSFCAWAKKKGEADAYAMSLDEIEQKVVEAAKAGIWEVHIVGGLHAELRTDFYEAMCRRIHARCPGMLIQGFTAVELDFLARRDHTSVDEVTRRLREAGLGGVPGGGAEIFAPRARNLICPTKINARQWLEVHERVHAQGLKSNATLLYGHVETPEERVDHMIDLREAQDRSGRFLAFVPLAFQPEHSRLSMQGIPRTSGVLDLQVLAVSRLMLDNWPHVRQLWNYVDEKLLAVSLSFGVDDLGGTNFNETIAKAAGSESKGFSFDALSDFIRKCGREPVECNSTYTDIRKEELLVSA